MDAVDRLDRLPLAGKRMTDPPESLARRAAEQVIDIDEMLQRGDARWVQRALRRKHPAPSMPPALVDGQPLDCQPPDAEPPDAQLLDAGVQS